MWIGVVLGGVLVLIAVVGPLLAPHDPIAVITDVFRVGDRVYVPSVQPVPPLTTSRFLLGTDIAGRDLFSRLLWGVRPTLILCAFIASLRLALGIILGLAAGWFGGPIARLIEIFIDVSLAVPILLFALAVISFIGDRELPTFILALVLTGWAGTAVFIRNNTLVIKREAYIEGARAVGVPPLGILRRYVLPQLWPALPALASFELAATLLVVAELGFLGLFIGETFVIMGASGEINETPIGLTANYPELAQMMANFWSKMIRTPWEVAFVGFAIFVIIFTFNMLGEGMRRQMDVTRSRGMRQRRR